MGWVVNATPLPFYPREIPGTLSIGDWVSPRDGLDECGISRLHQDSIPGPSSSLQTGHITLSSTPDQQLENHSTKYHRQQPLYNTIELLMMGIVVPETC